MLATTSLLLLLAVSARSEPGVTDKEVVIGTCGPLSGQDREMGQSSIQNAAPYFDYINKEKGGIYGRRLRLISRDDKYNAEEAIDCFKKLSDDGIFAAAFLAGSAPAGKYAAMAERQKMPILVLTANDFLYEPFKRYVFGLRPSYSVEDREFARHLVKDLHFTRIGVLMQNDALGASHLEGLNQALKEYGLAPAIIVTIARQTSDVSDSVRQMREAQPEAVLMAANYVPAAAFAKQARAAGLKSLFILGTPKYSFQKLAGAAAEGTVYSEDLPPFRVSELPAAELYRRILKKYAPGVVPSERGFEVFLQSMVLAEGLRRAGKGLDREKFVAAVETLGDFDIGLGPDFHLAYSSASHRGFDHDLYGIYRDGKPTMLEDWSALKR